MSARWALALVLAGCVDGVHDEPCRCIMYEVRMDDVGFDDVVVNLSTDDHIGYSDEYRLEPTRAFVYRYAHPYGSFQHLTVFAFDAQRLVGKGSAALEYEHLGNDYYEAKGTLWLAPP